MPIARDGAVTSRAAFLSAIARRTRRRITGLEYISTLPTNHRAASCATSLVIADQPPLVKSLANARPDLGARNLRSSLTESTEWPDLQTRNLRSSLTESMEWPNVTTRMVDRESNKINTLIVLPVLGAKVVTCWTWHADEYQFDLNQLCAPSARFIRARFKFLSTHETTIVQEG